MNWLLILFLIIGILVLLIFIYRKKIKAYLMKKLMDYASKKMMEAMMNGKL